ncbi:uncharacterized protein KY384_003694 [Bacidia gigantensis]|uniref:uncharacterized protein n=1 Tax=Bacidia gigantensis TaxID=2732470 RepID=UPI001D047E2C|nr:uncharacterized protein KY384_003694 [Bacidia gigantensis]KAG8532057.1 hypothetical protein KY384_003694 [Bacidia gigantensis]
MADYERRPSGHHGGYNNRKRRFRGDDDYDRRPQRRRYEEPLHVKIRKQLLSIAESPLKRNDEEIASIAKIIVENHEDEQIKSVYLDLSIQLVLEQPLKIPFIAGLTLATDQQKPDLSQKILERATSRLQEYLNAGAWREVKHLLRFLGCLQRILEGDGIFPVFEELFARAVDLQTASSEDSLGLELVKIILLALPCVMAINPNSSKDQALAILDKTEVIASTPHVLYTLVNPIAVTSSGESSEPLSFIALLQKQLQAEADQGWKLACIPRPYVPMEGFNTGDESVAKHKLPDIMIPSPVTAGTRPRLPEIYFSVYSDQEIETVAPVSDIASTLVRDSLIDTINIVDFNRNATAKFLIDVDCYFAPDTFVKRATQFDKLRNLDQGSTTWKPEDVVVDAVFSQLLQLPSSEHKLVYYHSVLTEACKIAPAAIAPSLGRAIRWLYQNVDFLDLELVYRFMDWFSHHLSNFGFTWKWTEWVDDVALTAVHPKKAFITGALEKEIRLSFAARIRGTLPEPYRPLISEAQEEDTPPFKYQDDQTPYAEQGRQLLQLLKKKAPGNEVQAALDSIQETASSLKVEDPLVPSTDAYTTVICYLGSKSLSHVLSQIERCKEHFLAIGPQSESARRQIITSVMDYWHDKPGVGVSIIDKLLNYTILTPQSVVQWALHDQLGKGKILAKAHVYEMIASTLAKVTGRVRQILIARNAPDLTDEQRAILDTTLTNEREEMSKLLALTEDALVGVAEGSNDAMAEGANQDMEEEQLMREWGQRWLRVVRRKRAVEEATVIELLQQAQSQMEGVENGVVNGVQQNGDDLEDQLPEQNGVEDFDQIT